MFTYHLLLQEQLQLSAINCFLNETLNGPHAAIRDTAGFASGPISSTKY